MRSLSIILLLIAHPLWAAECFPIGSDQSLVLRGIVEYRYETAGPPHAFELFLNLPSPICVQGSMDGRPYKKENLTSVLLGMPPKLTEELRDGESVTLRGAFWGPVGDDPIRELAFVVSKLR